MKISAGMNLIDLQERMGQATIEEAEAMRELLVEKFPGDDTADVPESAWMEMLDAAATVTK